MELERPKVTIKDFTTISSIGRGAYAKVILMKKDQKLYAMKIVKKKYLEKKKQERTVKTERDILISMNHPFIVKLFYSFQNQKKLFFALEYCPGGQLYTLINKQVRLSQEQAKFYISQIILALEYLHQHQIIYRDLKPENVLLDEQGYIKLTDFGLSKLPASKEPPNLKCGTAEYFAPQILHSEEQSKSIDWWCLGCLLYEMVVGLPPFYQPGNQKQLFRKIKYQNAAIPNFITSKSLVNLIQGLLQKKASVRIGSKRGASQIQEHPWFAKFDWKGVYNKTLKAPFPFKIQFPTDLRHLPQQLTQEPTQSPKDHSVKSDEGKVYLDFSFEKSREILIEQKTQMQEQGNNKFQLNVEQSEIKTLNQF